jgi:micrococcal nuclease
MTYHYRVLSIDRVIDGDTVVAIVDLGFSISMKINFRLTGINTPEVVGATQAAGLAAKAHLEKLLERPTWDVEVQSSKDKYGRYLGRFIVAGVDVNARMIADGHAVAYDGGKR